MPEASETAVGEVVPHRRQPLKCLKAGNEYVFTVNEADAHLLSAAPDLYSAAVLNDADAAAARNLWLLRKHGTDPAAAINGMLEILTRIEHRSMDAIAAAEIRRPA